MGEGLQVHIQVRTDLPGVLYQQSPECCRLKGRMNMKRTELPPINAIYIDSSLMVSNCLNEPGASVFIDEVHGDQMRDLQRKRLRKLNDKVIMISTFLLLIVISIQLLPMVRGSGIHPEREIVTGYEFSYDIKGYISEFTIRITFPQPLDTSFAEHHIEIHHGRDVWLVSENDFPYTHTWTNNSRTLEISSRGVDLSGKDIGIINIQISTPLMIKEGGFLWEDYDDIKLSFGEQDFNFGLGYGVAGTFAGFCLPSILLILILSLIEISLRSFLKRKYQHLYLKQKRSPLLRPPSLSRLLFQKELAKDGVRNVSDALGRVVSQAVLTGSGKFLKIATKFACPSAILRTSLQGAA